MPYLPRDALEISLIYGPGHTIGPTPKDAMSKLLLDHVRYSSPKVHVLIVFI